MNSIDEYINLYIDINLGIDVEISCCHFSYANFDVDFFSRYKIDFPVEVNRSTKSRQSEFFAGRYLASTLLGRSGEGHRPVAIGSEGEPCWPCGIVGSISHIPGYAICALASSEYYRYVGVDIEKTISTLVLNDIKSIILSDEEFLLQSESNMSMEEFCTLVFSAKESLFKATFLDVREKNDFDCVKVSRIIPHERKIVLSLEYRLSSIFNRKREFIVYYQRVNDLFVTCFAEEY